MAHQPKSAAIWQKIYVVKARMFILFCATIFDYW